MNRKSQFFTPGTISEQRSRFSRLPVSTDTMVIRCHKIDYAATLSYSVDQFIRRLASDEAANRLAEDVEQFICSIEARNG